ncbi:MAG: asparagine synthase (glutamine-hydrolyzing) [Acidobacteriota bacterium]|nr:asparagine synthase (glutamine-hydrolyzing) [Acidobacteriota bacterium]
MCGIAGFVETAAAGAEFAPEREALIGRMCRRIAHRGPDDQGAEVLGRAALGMRRLSIIDLAGGRQPMSGCDPRIRLVFNGEIYNYRELQRDLEARGHKFHTRSDTETIAHAYEEFGDACVEHLRGMFAFAVWDARSERLFAARDRAGEKPLYYTLTPRGTFVFGSELKCLLEHPEVTREVDPAALDSYLTFGYVPEPQSVFRGVFKLEAGCRVVFEGGRYRAESYWDFPVRAESGPAPRGEAECVEELRARLDEAVRMMLVADVPLGAFLSGGVDSSTVVGLMSRATNAPVKTFSVGFREDSFDELKYARLAARHFETDHRELIVTPEVCRLVDELVRHFDEPFADQSSIPTYLVSKLARGHVKVVLSGDGGDELFAGYTRYAVERRRRGFARLPRALRSGLMRPLSRRLPHGARGRNFIHNVALDPVDRYVDNVSVFNDLGKASLYTADFRRALAGSEGPAARFRALAARAAGGEQLDALLYLDGKTYLPGDILTKVDRMSMAVSLEARVPLLEHKLVEFAARLPASLKMRGAESKYIFKRAVRGLVPDEILDRPKQGFGVPINDWINRELRERIRDTFRDARTRRRGLVEPAYVDVLLDEHERGRRDHSPALWSLFILELWHRAYADETPGESVEAPSLVAAGG